MKQKFLKKNTNGNPIITLFFAGWGMDETPFSDIDFHKDTMLCYDYSDLSFDYSLIDNYQKVRLVAWSLGVWVAEIIRRKLLIYEADSIAINGTLFPIDDLKGIPDAIYTGTLDKLNEENLLKFYRRMCGNSNSFNEFLQIKPNRNIDDLKNELSHIKKEYMDNKINLRNWNMVYIGKNDNIFPYKNQKNAWANNTRKVIETEIAHYDKNFLKKILVNG